VCDLDTGLDPFHNELTGRVDEANSMSLGASIAENAMERGQLKVGLAKTADDLGKKGVDAIYSHGRVNAGRAAAAH